MSEEEMSYESTKSLLSDETALLSDVIPLIAAVATLTTHMAWLDSAMDTPTASSAMSPTAKPYLWTHWSCDIFQCEEPG